MFTLLMFVVAFLVASAILVTVTGIVAILPGVAVVVALFAADCFIFKLAFKRKK